MEISTVKQKICSVCGYPFNETRKDKTYCSQKCAIKAWDITHRKRRQYHRLRWYHANHQKKPLLIKNCKNCGEKFKQTAPKQYCCSLRCIRRYWRTQNKEKESINRKKWYKDNPEKSKEIRAKTQIKQRKTHPLKYEAYKKCRNTKLAEKCELCDSKKDLQRHHPDYTYPLIFVTVCQKCHEVIHRGKK